MSEKVRNNAEAQARREAVEFYKTLGIPWREDTSDAKLWRQLLTNTRTRFERFRYTPSGSDLRFIPQVYDNHTDEQINFISQVPNAGYQPTIEWRFLEKKTPETKVLFTAILCLTNGEPRISLMEETFSIFRVKDLKIDNLISVWVPKMECKTVTIERGREAYFAKDELGKKVDGGYIPVEEALQKIQIPKSF